MAKDSFPVALLKVTVISFVTVEVVAKVFSWIFGGKKKKPTTPNNIPAHWTVNYDYEDLHYLDYYEDMRQIEKIKKNEERLQRQATNRNYSNSQCTPRNIVTPKNPPVRPTMPPSPVSVSSSATNRNNSNSQNARRNIVTPKNPPVRPTVPPSPGTVSSSATNRNYSNSQCTPRNIVTPMNPPVRPTVPPSHEYVSTSLAKPLPPIRFIVVENKNTYWTKQENIVKELRYHKVIGFDCVVQTINGVRNPVAMLQLTPPEGTTVIFRLSKIWKIPGTLKMILGDSSICKVGFNPFMYRKLLLKDYGLYVKGVVNIKDLLRVVEIPKVNNLLDCKTLEELTKCLLHYDMDPKGKYSNWDAETLPLDQQTCAAAGSWAAIENFKQLAIAYNPSGTISG